MLGGVEQGIGMISSVQAGLHHHHQDLEHDLAIAPFGVLLLTHLSTVFVAWLRLFVHLIVTVTGCLIWVWNTWVQHRIWRGESFGVEVIWGIPGDTLSN